MCFEHPAGEEPNYPIRQPSAPLADTLLRAEHAQRTQQLRFFSILAGANEEAVHCLTSVAFVARALAVIEDAYTIGWPLL